MYVLRRYDFSTKLTYKFVSYTENTNTCITVINDKEAVTIFLENINSVKRALALGWIDETKEYNNNLEREYAKLEAVKSAKLADKTVNKNTDKKKRKTRKKKSEG